MVAVTKGLTFFVVGNHLGFVINSPELHDNKALIVNVSTCGTMSDQSCLIYIGDHKHIKHLSFVIYRLAMVKTIDEVQTYLSDGRFVMSPEQVKPDVITRAIKGALVSNTIPLDYRKLLD